MPLQIWHAAASLDDPGELEATCWQWLSSEEHARAQQFRKATTQNQFVVGRGMTRRLLGERLGLDPRSIRFRFSPHGKPHLDDSSAVEFNVAHTGGLVLCAIGDGQRVGVDVESAERRVDLGLAARYFARSEADWLARQAPHLQAQAFLRIWTLKESFIKAIGTGLTMPLDRFAFQHLDGPQPALTLEDPLHGPADMWQSFLLEPREGYIAAVTVNSSPRPTVSTHLFG